MIYYTQTMSPQTPIPPQRLLGQKGEDQQWPGDTRPSEKHL